MSVSIEKSAQNAFQALTQRREIKIWQGLCHWIESSPDIKGDYLVVLNQDGEHEILIQGEYAIGNQVHEYGGGDYTIHPNGDIYFIRQADQQIYCFKRQKKIITPITTKHTETRYADMDIFGNKLLALKETHDKDVQNVIVEIDLLTLKEIIVAEGHDFYASPRFSRNGKAWAYVFWDHPNLPWNQCQLCYGSYLEKDNMTVVNTSQQDVISQFCWTPDGQLLYTSDQTGWANLYINGSALHPSQKYFGFERWQQGQQNIAITDSGICVAIFGPPEERRLGRMVDNAWVPYDLACCDFMPFIATDKDSIYVIGAYSHCSPKILCIDAVSGVCSVICEDTQAHDAESVVVAKHIEFPTLDGQKSHAFFYHAKEYADAKQPSPLLVLCHGGPTAFTSRQWDPMIQFWVGQGISVVDVNYRGSTGYGRAYQDALRHEWGVIDVADCIAARDYLVKKELVDGERCFIRGKSSGGLTTLRALMWQGKFAAGGCYYGVSDLTQLLKITHKFEKYYLDYLIGPFPKDKQRYIDRSPTHDIQKITSPIIFFHGLLDKVVPPSQTTMMIEALETNHIPCEYHAFPDEKHGFKNFKNKITALINECQFYLSK